MVRHNRITIIITHADGYREKLRLTNPIANVLIKSLVNRQGWPYVAVSMPDDANDFITGQAHADNVFTTHTGKLVYC